jgi:phage shock protein E
MFESITYPRVRELLESGAQFVDVLSAREYREQHLPGAVNIPLKTLDAQTTARLDRGRAVVVYCYDGP